MSERELLALAFAGASILLLFCLFLIYLFHYLRKRNERYRNDRVSLENQVHQEKIEESERLMNEISRDFHDHIIQSLIALKWNVGIIDGNATNDQQSQCIARISQLADQVILEANNISRSLNSDFIKTTSLPASIRAEAVRICGIKKIAVMLTEYGDMYVLDGEKKLLIYRIAQDAFRNIVQHSGATNVDISLKIHNGHFSLTIEDNGCGISNDRLHTKLGMGLKNMRSRAKYLNGQLNINSVPGQGCSINLIVSDANFGVN